MGAEALTAEQLRDHGLLVDGDGAGVMRRLRWERPAYLFAPRRVKNTDIGAFSYLNGHGTVSLYETSVGRYCSIAEGAVVGSYEHPVEGLTTHPLAFGGRAELPLFYELPDYARSAPEQPADPQFMSAEIETWIGHDVWIGANAVIKRGLSVGAGAVVAANAMVTRDVEPFTIVAGVPARPLRSRFSSSVCRRQERIAWWRYDLSPAKERIDWRSAERALDAIERLLDDDALQLLSPATYQVRRIKGPRFTLESLDRPLF